MKIKNTKYFSKSLFLYTSSNFSINIFNITTTYRADKRICFSMLLYAKSLKENHGRVFYTLLKCDREQYLLISIKKYYLV